MDVADAVLVELVLGRGAGRVASWLVVAVLGARGVRLGCRVVGVARGLGVVARGVGRLGGRGRVVVVVGGRRAGRERVAACADLRA